MLSPHPMASVKHSLPLLTPTLWCVACATVAQAGGTHYSTFCPEISFVGSDALQVMCGVARPGLDALRASAWTTEPCQFWGYYHDGAMMTGAGGAMYYGGNAHHWAGQQGYEAEDVLRLLLDSDAGTLTVKKNGVLLGVAVSEGLTGDLCWAVAVHRADGVRIKAVDPANF